MDDEIRYMETTTGIQVRFPRNVSVDGTRWGTRIALTHDEVRELYTRLGQHLGLVACTCSQLVHGTDYRCALHPDNQALSFDERMAFEQKFDKHIEEAQK